MQVEEIKPIGYCLGVVQAINNSLKIQKEYQNRNIYVFGLLVHNDAVIKFLEEHNIKTMDISNVDINEKLNSFNKDDIVIFTAHGHPKYYEEILSRKGVLYFDTTCVRVKKNMELIENNLNKRQIIYVGHKNHPETIAALSLGKNVILYELGKEFDYQKISSRDPIVINQTTLSFLELQKIHQEIINNIPKAIIQDEICNATRIRQEKLLQVNGDIDLVIIIGSKKSSNSKKLYEVALNKLKDKKVYMVDNVNELKSLDLKLFKKALIASGTSTSLETINDIKEYLKEI